MMDDGLFLLLVCGSILSVGTRAGYAAGSAPTRGVPHVVSVPVADVRGKPNTFPTAGTHDPLQETQLVYGERVNVVKTDGVWAYVEAIEQPEFTHHHRWEGYPGWVLKDLLQPLQHPTQKPNAVITAKWATIWKDPQALTPQMQLPMGAKVLVMHQEGELWQLQLLSGASAWVSRGSVSLLSELEAMPSSVRRTAIVHAAEEFLGDPYFWGGRSPFSQNASGVTSVDCSGMVNLVYRSVGLAIPRDSHEQRLRARKITTLKPADLVFLSDVNRPAKTIHVMLYAGDGWLIEAPYTGLSVRRVSVLERLGRPVQNLKPGDKIDLQTISFGAYLP